MQKGRKKAKPSFGVARDLAMNRPWHLRMAGFSKEAKKNAEDESVETSQELEHV